MSTKNIFKLVVAFGLLAVLLAFLGVNFVPRIAASSRISQNTVNSVKLPRADYLDERFPRAIVPALTQDKSDFFLRHPSIGLKSRIYTGSDWIERHPTAVINSLRYVGSDFFERHPTAVINSLRYVGSDFFERHPTAVINSLRYVGSDFFDRHPSNYYSNLDYFQRHPDQTNP
jgi:hypothetical protein